MTPYGFKNFEIQDYFHEHDTRLGWNFVQNLRMKTYSESFRPKLKFCSIDPWKFKWFSQGSMLNGNDLFHSWNMIYAMGQAIHAIYMYWQIRSKWLMCMYVCRVQTFFRGYVFKFLENLQYLGTNNVFCESIV
jgi:hypothetical protein